jgi:dihydrodipicolinate synthase/N-acetylneuraminate lyase
LISEGLREIWDLYQAGKDPTEAQEHVTHNRHTLEKYMPFPPILKALMHRLYEMPHWTVKPPLEDVSQEALERALKELEA